jgi:hypothetical protein
VETQALRAERFLLGPSRHGVEAEPGGIVLSLVVSLIALALAIYGAAAQPVAAPARPATPSLSASRFFVLLPDGRVEMTDAYTRRVFRWDGRRWLELESRPIARPNPQ